MFIKLDFDQLCIYVGVCYCQYLEFVDDDKLYTRHVMTDFPIVNVPYLSSNIPESPAYGVSHLLGFVRNMTIFCSWDLFWFRHKTLFTNLTLLYHIC